MFDIGFLELLLVAVVSLLVLGPERLPVAARKAGLWIGRVRRFTSQVSQEIDKQIKAEELRERLRKEGDTLGLEKIQGTVDDALKKAREFEHLVQKDVTVPDAGHAEPRSQEDEVNAPSSNPLSKEEPVRERTAPDRTSD